jgi:Flp pilus assembly protein CpaB
VAVPVALGVLAAGFGYEALASKSAMTEVVVAQVALSRGEAVDAGNTRLVRVHSSDRSLLRDLVSAGQLDRGWVVSVPVPAGEPLTASELARPSTGPVLGEMSIAVPADQAVGGRLVAGDMVDVIANTAQGGAYYVAQGLRVLSVAAAPQGSGALLGTSTSYYVVVSIGKKIALRVAAALGEQNSGGNGVQLVRSSGEPSTAATSYQGPGHAAS